MPRYYARQEFFGWLLFDTESHYYVSPSTREALAALAIIIDERRMATEAELTSISGDAQAAAEAIGWLTNSGCHPDAIEIATRNPLPAKLSAPLNVYFDYTSVCNLSCTICYDEPKRAGLKRHTELSLAEIDEVFAQLRRMGVFRVDLAGGEPILFPEFLLAYLDGARSRKISVSMTTNASRLGLELARSILERDLKTITVSIDGHTAPLNDEIRGKGSFDKAMIGIQNLLTARKELGARTSIAIKYTFRHTTSPEQIDGYVQLGRSLGVDKVKFNPLRPSGAAAEDRELVSDPPAYYRVLGEIARMARSYPDVEVSGPINPTTCFGGRISHLTDWGCIAGKELMTIDSQGNVRPCSMMNDFVVGNIRSQPLAEIYHRSRLNLLRGLQNEGCSSCPAYKTCRGGCRVRSQAAGNFFAKDPLCPTDAGQPIVLPPARPVPFEYIGLPHAL